MIKVWFVRHAESQANAGERTSLPAQIALTPLGRRQAECVAAAFPRPPALVVTSAYVRTRQTAASTLARFPQVPQAEWPVHEFTYLAPARCVNLTLAERRPLVAAYWERNDPAYVDGEGAESFAALIGRVDDTLQRLRQPADTEIAVFSHGQFMRAVLWRLLGNVGEVTAQAMRQFYGFLEAWPIPNAGIVILCFETETDVWIKPVTWAHIPPELLTL